MPPPPYYFPFSLLLLCAAVLVAISTLPGCQRAQDMAMSTTLERAAPVKMEKNGNHLAFKSEESQSIPLPANFPEDIYLPNQHRVASVMDISDAQVVNLSAPDTITVVFSSVGSAMEKTGWKREMAMQSGDGGSLAFSKDKRHAVYYLAKNESGGTDLTVNSGQDN